MRSVGIFLLVSLCLAGPAAGQPPDLIGLIGTLPGDQKVILNTPDVGVYNPSGEAARWKVVKAPDVVGKKAMRVTVREAGPDPWSTEISAGLANDVAEGDVVFIALLARAVKADNEAQNGVISNFSIQQNSGEYKPVAAASALVPLGEWRLFHGWGRAGVDLAPETGMVSIHLGATKQVIDIGPLIAVNLGPDVDTEALPQPTLDYAGRSADAPWRKAAEARIAEHRISPLTVEVVDADGTPIETADVAIRMTRSAFGFGTFVGHDVAGKEGEDGDRFRAAVLDGFNLATAPIYWQDWGWLDPEMRENYLGAMTWLNGHDMPFRAHPIVWPVERFLPSCVRALEDDAAVRDAVLTHVREVVSATETFGPVAYDAYNEPHVGEYLPGKAGGDVADAIFSLADEIDPDAPMFINDYGMLSGGGLNEENLGFYERWIREHLDRRVPVEGIGFQGHFGAALTHPARLVEILDRFSAFGLPIHITEFDVDTKDEAAQADYLRDALIAAYSVPAVEAFVVWGFWEGDHWRPDAAMIRTDWTEKPAWAAWREVQARWRTDEVARTGPGGTVVIDAHHGSYEIDVRGPAGSIARARTRLGPGGKTVRVTLD